ncbi:fermentative D-lactate dehydrogenase, NAD-dependent [Planktothrix serta PCC 8927]|uniref:Fermentative D-lactate dehydrogenase, NAD-dependent n=1 Tax=Planktothrix serta PCC 8927 TaxID=671068 RepID=A0A7Z9E5I4_9CYAN|nr:2-hydroxyacid dehydrogenase [Planktothrix serta]VXD25385.1 fermentative D-lactate dehydrogenase, NAD-dependent [Planktothrix serta PCC 8927]
MKVAVFSTKSYDRRFLELENTISKANHELVFFDARLELQTASLANGFSAVCVFVNDDLGTEVLEILAAQGTKLIALRCTGFNNVNLKTAAKLGIQVVRVTDYSPYSVAEHAVGLILMLNRKLYRAYNRVREDNFALDGLLGFDLHNRTVGVVGTGKIGLIFAQIMQGFGCHLLGYDVYPNPNFEKLGNAQYVSLEELWQRSDIISLHCPLFPETHHLINQETIAQMKSGVMLINTSRGKLVDTKAVIDGIKSEKIGYVGIDVYEEEDKLFFEDLSDTIIQDDTFQLLQSFPNVVITAHQGFFTENALDDIARTTITNLSAFEQGKPLQNQVTAS